MARHAFLLVSIRTVPGGLADVLRRAGEAMDAEYVEVCGKRCREALAAVWGSLPKDRRRYSKRDHTEPRLVALLVLRQFRRTAAA